jgi:hypothetical protein
VSKVCSPSCRFKTQSHQFNGDRGKRACQGGLVGQHRGQRSLGILSQHEKLDYLAEFAAGESTVGAQVGLYQRSILLGASPGSASMSIAIGSTSRCFESSASVGFVDHCGRRYT